MLCLIEGLSDVQADRLYSVPIKKKIGRFCKNVFALSAISSIEKHAMSLAGKL